MVRIKIKQTAGRARRMAWGEQAVLSKRNGVGKSDCGITIG